MFIRIKRVSGRRYVYLVEGRRNGKSVKQRVVAYLGPFALLATGVPDELRRKAESKSRKKLDWDKITAQINRVPIEIDELGEIRRRGFSTAVWARSFAPPFKPTTRPPFGELLSQRADGELAALTKLAYRRFNEIFEKLDDRTYRLRS
jgi:hypothetical protein